jgi:hypothetical protein
MDDGVEHKGEVVDVSFEATNFSSASLRSLELLSTPEFFRNAVLSKLLSDSKVD